MKQTKPMDIEAMLRDLPSDADKALDGLYATPFLKARIDRAAEAKKRGHGIPALPKWAPALCCCALVLVIALLALPNGNPQSVPLINSATLGTPTDAPAGVLTADLRSGDISISASPAKPGYRNIWSDVHNGSFPLIGVKGKYYRMLTNPNTVDASLLGAQIAQIEEFTTEPSLSGADAVLSNTAAFGTAVYEVIGAPSSALIAAEVNGRMRLFQRVSFNGNALRGKENLANTLATSGQIIGMELSGVGTVTDPAACQVLADTLLDNACYESSGSLSSRQALLIELNNGLVLQLAVKGDKLAGCGVWSCPEFFEAFDASLD